MSQPTWPSLRRIVRTFARLWQVECAFRFGKSDLGAENVRVRTWEHRPKLLGLLRLPYAFLVQLLDASPDRVRVLRLGCHRTGRRVETASGKSSQPPRRRCRFCGGDSLVAVDCSPPPSYVSGSFMRFVRVAAEPRWSHFSPAFVLAYREQTQGQMEEISMSTNSRYTAPYINFQGRAREALEFYHGILGGSLAMYCFDPGSGALKAAGPTDPIGYARLRAGDVRLYGSDGNPAYPATPGDTIAITLAGPDKDGMVEAFNALAAGGTIGLPLTEAPWGTAGWVTDRFGITWNIDIVKA